MTDIGGHKRTSLPWRVSCYWQQKSPSVLTPHLQFYWSTTNCSMNRKVSVIPYWKGQSSNPLLVVNFLFSSSSVGHKAAYVATCIVYLQIISPLPPLTAGQFLTSFANENIVLCCYVETTTFLRWFIVSLKFSNKIQ